MESECRYRPRRSGQIVSSGRQDKPTEGLSYLLNQAGEKVDRNLVQRFVRCVGVYPPGSLVRLSSDELAVVLDVHEQSTLTPRVLVVYDIAKEQLLESPRRVDLGKVSNKLRIVAYELPDEWPVPTEYLVSRG